MTFTGFQVQYPEYEVITPQTKQSFTLRSLNVSEEERLKGSLVTPNKIADHLNSCIYQAIIKKPAEITNLDSFLHAVTLKDRDALLYGLYHITYEEIRNYQLKCGECSHEYSATVQASSTFNFNAYQGDNIISERPSFELPVTKGVFVTLKQPTLHDEAVGIKSLGNRPGSTLELITETLIIESFEQDVPERKDPIVYKDRVDIIDAYLSLPAKDKREIFKQYSEKFGQYGVDLKMKSACTSCGHEAIHTIDLVESFFRALYSS
jgi:hypothetical protein